MSFIQRVLYEVSFYIAIAVAISYVQDITEHTMKILSSICYIYTACLYKPLDSLHKIIMIIDLAPKLPTILFIFVHTVVHSLKYVLRQWIAIQLFILSCAA